MHVSTGTCVCMYVCIHPSCCVLNFMMPHADQILPKLLAPHNRLSRPACARYQLSEPVCSVGRSSVHGEGQEVNYCKVAVSRLRLVCWMWLHNRQKAERFENICENTGRYNAPDIWKSTAFWKVSRLRLFVLLVRATCRWSFYRCTVHFEIYTDHIPTNALFINLVKSFKFALKYTIISLPHVSVFNDYNPWALSVPN